MKVVVASLVTIGAVLVEDDVPLTVSEVMPVVVVLVAVVVQSDLLTLPSAPQPYHVVPFVLDA